MFDWNGNGQIDPVDIGISLYLESDKPEFTEKQAVKKPCAFNLFGLIARSFTAGNSKTKNRRNHL